MTESRLVCSTRHRSMNVVGILIVLEAVAAIMLAANTSAAMACDDYRCNSAQAPMGCMGYFMGKQAVSR